MKFLGYRQKNKLSRLFCAWLDCFALLKLGAAEICALGELLVMDHSASVMVIHLRPKSNKPLSETILTAFTDISTTPSSID